MKLQNTPNPLLQERPFPSEEYLTPSLGRPAQERWSRACLRCRKQTPGRHRLARQMVRTWSDAVLAGTLVSWVPVPRGGHPSWCRASLQDTGGSRKCALRSGPPFRPGGGGCRGSSPPPQP